MLKPNILIVVLDSLRPEFLSCYGCERETSPTIDRLASDGFLFETAISPSAWTFPVMASVFTGMLPTKHGGHDEHRVLDTHYPTMAEVFSNAGYDTAAIADVPYVGPVTKLNRGFRFMSNLRRDQVSTRNLLLKAIGCTHRTLTRQYHKTNETRVVIGEAMRWLDSGWDRSRPFLLYLHSDETHAPLAPPVRYRRRFAGVSAHRMRSINQDKQLYIGGAAKMTDQDFTDLRNLARAEAAYFDGWLGWLLRRLKGLGVFDDTIIVVMADHGDNFGEHGLLRHGLCLYDTLLRVPLIIRPPGGCTAVRVKPMVQLIDLLPTLMSMASVSSSQAETEFQGLDLLVRMHRSEFPKFAISELYRPTTGLFEARVPHFMPQFRAKYDRVLRSYRTHSQKFIWSSNGQHELYDLLHDPREERDAYESQPQFAAEMQTGLDEWLKSFNHARVPRHATCCATAEAVPDDQQVLARLRDLGYVE